MSRFSLNPIENTLDPKLVERLEHERTLFRWRQGLIDQAEPKLVTMDQLR